MRILLLVLLLTGCQPTLIDVKIQAHNGKLLAEALEYCRIDLTEWNGTVEECHGKIAQENLADILKRHPEWRFR